MPKNWPYLLAALIVVGAGLLLLFVAGLFVFMSATATPLHPRPEEIPALAGTSPPAEWREAVEESRRLLRAALADQNLPGLSAAVGVNRRLVWDEGFGWADLERRTPFAPDTRVRIGTASMALTSAAVGLLLEEGRLALDDPIRKHVPEYPEQRWPITLRHLMGHLSGIRNDRGDEGPLSEHCERTIEGLALFRDFPLLFEPGTRFRFSSFSWILVSAAVEAASGEPFLRVMRHRVFDPIGMEDTKPDSVTDSVANRATFYFPRFAADPRYGPEPTRRIDYSCYAGASVFLSTPSDLVRFAMAIDGGTLLQPATVRLLQSPQRLPSGDETGYGLGWAIGTITLAGTPVRRVGHLGTTMGGPVASLVSVADHGLAVSVTSNMAYADVETLAVNIARVFLQQDAYRKAP